MTVVNVRIGQVFWPQIVNSQCYNNSQLRQSNFPPKLCSLYHMVPSVGAWSPVFSNEPAAAVNFFVKQAMFPTIRPFMAFIVFGASVPK